MTAIDDLSAHLRAFKSAPFLFVGSGLSRRYLKLPDWEGLLRTVADKTGRPYGYFVTGGDGEFPAVATAIAEALHEPWWNEPGFAESRATYAELLRTRSGPLKAEIAQVVDSALANAPQDGLESEELVALGSAVVDGLITTNYDRLLETVFPDYKVFVGQDELLFTDPQGIGEIYKIHGDAAAPESIVVTAKDFGEFRERNPYLAAKLLTIFVEHPVIFLGYSLRDPDVTEILASIATVLTEENLAKLEKNLVLVEWDPDVPTATLSRGLVSAAGFTIPVQVVRVPAFLELFQMLGALERKFSAPVLRRLKEHVYELVRSNEPSGRLFVSDLDQLDDADDVDVVIGVGMQGRLSAQGYRGIQRIDLLLDVVQPRSDFNAKQIVEDVLPELLKQTGPTPIYRYLREAGLLTKDGALRADAVVNEKIRSRVEQGVSAFAVPASTRPRAQRAVSDAGGDLSALEEQQGTSQAMAAAPELPFDRLDLDELALYLNERRSSFTGEIADRANWSRLVGLYDYLRFAKGR